MVSVRYFALAAHVFTASALLPPSLDTFFGSVSGSAASVLDKIRGGQGEVIQVFPGTDEKPIPGNAPIVNCDASVKQVLDLHSVVIDPNPPVKGQNLTFVAQGFLSEDVTDGAYVDVDVRYGFIRLVHQTFDLCEEIQNVDLECPVKKGAQLISKSVLIPEEVPPGKYLVNARAYTKDDELITCLTATVEFPAN